MAPARRNREPYELLAAVYGKEWGAFSERFLRFVDLALERCDAVPASALDLACGTGSSGEFQVGDMRSFDLDETFDLITCAFDSLNYLLDLDDVVSAFTCVRTHLQPDGLFLFDVNTPRLYEARHHGIIEREVEGVGFRQVLRYEAKERLAYTTFRFGQDEEAHVQRAYGREEIELQLRKAGLRPLDVHGDMRGAPATRASERLFLIAKPDPGF